MAATSSSSPSPSLCPLFCLALSFPLSILPFPHSFGHLRASAALQWPLLVSSSSPSPSPSLPFFFSLSLSLSLSLSCSSSFQFSLSPAISLFCWFRPGIEQHGGILKYIASDWYGPQYQHSKPWLVELSEGKDQVSESLESRGVVPVQRSPDAAVGALVQMLKTAPPLQQDLSNSIRSSQVFRGEFWNLRIQHNESMEAEVAKSESPAPNSGITASGLFKPRTAADGLEELRIYKEMTELLLKQGGSKSLCDNHKDKPACGGSS